MKSHSVLGLKVNLGRLETRLNCVELAKEQDTGERGLYTIQRGAQTKTKREEGNISRRERIV